MALIYCFFLSVAWIGMALGYGPTPGIRVVNSYLNKHSNMFVSMVFIDYRLFIGALVHWWYHENQQISDEGQLIWIIFWERINKWNLTVFVLNLPEFFFFLLSLQTVGANKYKNSHYIGHHPSIYTIRWSDAGLPTVYCNQNWHDREKFAFFSKSI